MRPRLLDLVRGFGVKLPGGLHGEAGHSSLGCAANLNVTQTSVMLPLQQSLQAVPCAYTARPSSGIALLLLLRWLLRWLLLLLLQRPRRTFERLHAAACGA